ncbi:MAG TPA: hypothetical protein VF271_06430 [Rhodanobacteraceae bacterium]
MNTNTLISVAAAVLITAAVSTSLALAMHGQPTQRIAIDGPVTTLPTVNVIATPLPASSSVANQA